MPSTINTQFVTRGQNKEALTGIVTTTTGGTIGSQDCDGFVVTKTAAENGRYTVVLSDKYRAIEYAHAVIEGSADSAAAAAKGQVCQVRGVDASTKTVLIQFLTPSLAAGASVDADVEDAAKIRIFIVASTGNA